jgi:DNA processing protein
MSGRGDGELWLWAAASGITPPQFGRLTEAYGDLPGIARAVGGGERADPRLSAPFKRLRDAMRPAEMDALRAAMERYAVRLITREDAAYPPLLRVLEHDAPIALFVRGEADLARPRQFAIVGSRACSRYGAQITQRIAAGLASDGITVVSGMARGIDTSAHLGALSAGGCTVAVMGCGVDVAYPPENEQLIDRVIAEGGAAISEYAPGMPPQPWNFPVRNRILSGMCSGLLVAEATERSGAMITVRHALAQGREVYALPGPVDSPTSMMPLTLLREGGAMATSAEDIMQSMRWLEAACDLPMGKPPGVPPRRGPAPRQVSMLAPDLSVLAEEERRVVEAMRGEETVFAELVERTGLPVSELNSHLTMLELQGIIVQFPGRIFKLAR